MTFSWNLTMLT